MHKGSEERWRDFLRSVADEIECEEALERQEIKNSIRHAPGWAGPGERDQSEPTDCKALSRIAQSKAWALWHDYEDAVKSRFLEPRAINFVEKKYKLSSTEMKKRMRERFALIQADPLDE